MNCLDIKKSQSLAIKLSKILIKENWNLATAESCTGGLISKIITDTSGSSEWFTNGIITYSNSSKVRFLNIDEGKINDKGVVSEIIALDMAKNIMTMSGADISVGVTGIAGPEGGNDSKPVGTVCFGWATKVEAISETCYFTGDREAIRYASAEKALYGLIEIANLSTQ
ncbi:MAG: damage-inducible protein CinA [Gammaproteobacteria bacterium]|nr:damage-inducible protein CinA [Gammaproteobacteria bacterium]